MMVSKSTWSYKRDVCELKIGDAKQSFRKRNACVWGTNDNDASIFNDFSFTK